MNAHHQPTMPTQDFIAERRQHPRTDSSGVPSAPDVLLELRGFGAAYGDKVVLSEISFNVPDTGITVLLGPTGTGKSTLLRTLAGLSSASPTFRSWGDIFYRGAPLGSAERPELVAQSAKLMMSSVLENVVVNLPERNQLTATMQRDLAQRLLQHAGLQQLTEKLDEPVVSLSLAQQRHLAILRQVAAGPRLLCIDEPTSGLNEVESEILLNYLRKEASRRALLVILHNQQHARRLGGTAVLIAGGHVQEWQDIPAVFVTPASEAGREFARSGSCSVASPGTPVECLDDTVPPPKPLPKAALNYSGSSAGPRGFLWLEPGRLAGTPLPGVYFDIDYDLKALCRVGITTLVTLTETSLDSAQLEPFGLKNIWEPIPDMGAPTIEQAIGICQKIEQALMQNEVVAVHCRAGLGRTGTVLAAQLIWEGRPALEALETVRGIEPRWVQSPEQVTFLEEFEKAVTKIHALPVTGNALMS